MMEYVKKNDPKPSNALIASAMERNERWSRGDQVKSKVK